MSKRYRSQNSDNNAEVKEGINKRSRINENPKPCFKSILQYFFPDVLLPIISYYVGPIGRISHTIQLPNFDGHSLKPVGLFCANHRLVVAADGQLVVCVYDLSMSQPLLESSFKQAHSIRKIVSWNDHLLFCFHTGLVRECDMKGKYIQHKIPCISDIVVIDDEVFYCDNYNVIRVMNARALTYLNHQVVRVFLTDFNWNRASATNRKLYLSGGEMTFYQVDIQTGKCIKTIHLHGPDEDHGPDAMSLLCEIGNELYVSATYDNGTGPGGEPLYTTCLDVYNLSGQFSHRIFEIVHNNDDDDDNEENRFAVLSNGKVVVIVKDQICVLD